jgi:HlyD family secretion protein
MKTTIAILLAIAGVIAGLSSVNEAAAPPETLPPVSTPGLPPFPEYLAGTGLIEASTENIAVASPRGAIIDRVHVEIGQTVRKGDPLYELDARAAQRELEVRRANLQLEQSRLERLQQSARKEEIEVVQAQLQEADAQLTEAVDKANRGRQLVSTDAISGEDLVRLESATLAARARVARSRADLEKLMAGTWAPDLRIAELSVQVAQAQVDAAADEVIRSVVRSPVDGQVLDLNARVGEFADSGPRSSPLVVVGNTDLLHVRVDIDENDAWRFVPQAAAIAYLRGNQAMKTEVEFVRFPPMVVGKRSLTGDSSERIDTRVLQVIYRFRREQLPNAFIGQQLDVFIQIPSTPSTATVAIGQAS